LSLGTVDIDVRTGIATVDDTEDIEAEDDDEDDEEEEEEEEFFVVIDTGIEVDADGAM
jgi:hypothetical protein